MSDVDRLFDQYREAHRSGGEADPRGYLDKVDGADRTELAALIDGYLARAPGRSWDPQAFEGSVAQRVTEAIASGWEEQPEPVAWRELLPRLRNAAQVKRADLVARLADAIGAANQAEKVAAYYHQMETGQLPSEGVSNRVLAALAEIVGESAERLRAAGSVIGAGGSERQARTQVAFARTAVNKPEYADEVRSAPAAASPSRLEAAGDEDDLVDRLFTGGPDAGG